jgi:rhamnose transport system substrate-binding protein
VFFLPKFVGVPVFSANETGAKEAAAALGDTLTFNGPTSASATLQAPFLTSAIAQGDKAIVYDPNDPNALTPILRNALHKGIKIVTYDSDVTNTSLRSIYVGPPAGDVVAKDLLNIVGAQIGYKGAFAIMSATPEDPTANIWDKAIAAALTTPKYAGMKLVKTVYGNNSAATSVQQTQALLLAYPQLKAIISTAGGSTASVAQVVQSQKKCSSVAVTGLATPSSMRSYVTGGCVKAVALWNEIDFGYLAMYAAHLVLTGVLKGTPGETFMAGRLGRQTVGANGVVSLSKVTDFTKENITSFNY